MPVGRERKWAEIGTPEGLNEKTEKEGLTRGDAQEFSTLSEATELSRRNFVKSGTQ